MLLEKLKNRRKELGISQEKLSKSLGRAETFISKVERGERRLDAFELILLARALELDPKVFFAAYVDAIDKM